MATTTQSKKLERMEQRVPAHVKKTIERAAAMQGRSASDFVTQASLAAAEDAILRHDRIVLRGQDAAFFVESILNPTKPTPEMIKAAHEYLAFVGEE